MLLSLDFFCQQTCFYSADWTFIRSPLELNILSLNKIILNRHLLKTARLLLSFFSFFQTSKTLLMHNISAFLSASGSSVDVWADATTMIHFHVTLAACQLKIANFVISFWSNNLSMIGLEEKDLMLWKGFDLSCPSSQKFSVFFMFCFR